MSDFGVFKTRSHRKKPTMEKKCNTIFQQKSQKIRMLDSHIFEVKTATKITVALIRQ